MIEKIVQTAKQTVKAMVDADSARDADASEVFEWSKKIMVFLLALGSRRLPDSESTTRARWLQSEKSQQNQRNQKSSG
jgi:hypothetical protein